MNICRTISLLLSFLAVFAMSGSSAATQPGTLDGMWEGKLTRIHGPGLTERDAPPQTWRFVIEGDIVHVFIIRDGQVQEVKSGRFRIQRHMTNAVISAVDSGGDSDGTWVESEAFTLLLKRPDTVGVIFAGAINNVSSPLDQPISKMLSVATGDFVRVR